MDRALDLRVESAPETGVDLETGKSDGDDGDDVITRYFFWEKSVRPFRSGIR
jgi:hypothetical protein